MKFDDVKDLVKLEYFSKNENGDLILNDGYFDDGIIDFHAHLGFNYLLSKKIDLQCPCRTQHFFPEEGNPIDLDNYAAYDFTPDNAKRCQRETMKQALNNKGISKTHTVPNIIAEMDRMKVEKSVILAVELVIASKNSEHILENVKDTERLIPFISIHPLTLGNKREKMESFISDGARGIKIHPPIQMIKPSNKLSMELLQLARQFKLPVLYHSGHSPLSPEFERKYVEIKDYETAIKEYPDVTIIMGHSSIDRFREAALLGKKYDNVYLELSGQPPQAIKEIINIMGDEKILFGSDWPFYPLAFPLAKVLLATEGNAISRERILRTNAQSILNKYPKQDIKKPISMINYLFSNIFANK